MRRDFLEESVVSDYTLLDVALFALSKLLTIAGLAVFAGVTLAILEEVKR